MGDINWSEWHEASPPVRGDVAAAKCTVSVKKGQKLVINFNKVLIAELNWGSDGLPWPCRIWNGTGKQAGTLLVRSEPQDSIPKKGKVAAQAADKLYYAEPVMSDRFRRISGMVNDLFPDEAMSVQPCKFKVHSDGRSILITLPDWFPRDALIEDAKRSGD